MGLLRRLLSQKTPEQDIATKSTPHPEPLQETMDTKAPLSKAQLELLQRLGQRAMDTYLVQTWSPIVGPIEGNIARFMQDGLIVEASLVVKLDQKLRVADLKSLLNQYNIEARGKKADLINALVAATPSDELKKLVSDLRLYEATPLGQQVINEHLEQKKRIREVLEAQMLKAIQEGDFVEAGRLAAKFESDQVFARGMGIDWSHGMPEDYVKQARYLGKHRYADLPYSKESRDEIAAQMALSHILGENLGQTTERVLAVSKGEFTCKPLLEFIKSNPEGQAVSVFGTENLDEVSPKKLAGVYVHTKLTEAYAKIEMNSLLKLKKYTPGWGIQVSTSNDDHVCQTCNRNSKRTYTWSEIDKLQIPEHWGCRCTYSMVPV